MGDILVFCTSPSVTPKLLDQLNAECGRDEFSNAEPDSSGGNIFTPAPHSVDDFVQSSGPCQHIDYFEGKSEDELRQLFEDQYQDNPDVEETFAILDRRSAEDKTIIIYSEADFEEDEMEEIIASHWVSWRVRFEESYILCALLETKCEFYDNVFSHWDRFVGEDGIFPINHAMKLVAEEGEAESRPDAVATRAREGIEVAGDSNRTVREDTPKL